ncbi:MAG: hypothetical protein ACMXYM_00450 [Candidatus Woesearchaeota archaeon]
MNSSSGSKKSGSENSSDTDGSLRRLVVLVALVYVFVALASFSIDRLTFASYGFFTLPLAAAYPVVAVAVLFAALAGALILVFRAALECSSDRAAWAALALVLVSSPMLLSAFSVSLGYLAAPLLVYFAFQLSTRRYRLVSIALPIAVLFVLGYGHYVLFVLFALLLTTPLRPDPDPRLGELFLLTAVAFIATGSVLSFEFSVERALPFGLVFIALGVFATYRVIMRGSRRVDPYVALALASAVLFFLSDPLAPLMLTLSAGVLVAIALEVVMRFFELSRIPFKRLVSFSTVVFFVVLTLVQSVFFLAAQERMDPGLAASLMSVDEGVVAIDEQLSHALAFYSGAQVVPLTSEEVELLETSPFVIPVIERSEGRFSRVVLSRMPPYVSNECFVAEPRGVLVEVRIRCSLS